MVSNNIQRMRLGLFFILFISVNVVVAQKKDTISVGAAIDGVELDNEIKKKTTRADIHYKNGDYAMALTNLNDVAAVTPNDPQIHYKSGLCNLKLNNDSLALVSFQKAYAINAGALPDIEYYLALSNHLNGKYDEALGFYTKEKEKSLAKAGVEYTKEIDKRIAECAFAKQLMPSKDTTIQLYTIGDSINSTSNESTLYLLADTLMYLTSSRPGKSGVVSENIFKSVYRAGKWARTIDLGKPINTLANDAVIGLTNNGERLYLYADVNGGDIFVSDKKGEVWSRPLPFSDSINSSALESSLCFSADNNTLYFVSNRRGTIGGKDIFYAFKNENSWSAPINLGAVVNSEYDEESPFMIGDTMYFSSKGHNSVGGYDVFKTFKQNNVWTKPVNLGFPVNSPYDELSFTIGNKLRYIISDRQGGKGETDIYEIDLIENRKPKNILPPDEFILVIDSSETNLPDSLAVIDENKSTQEQSAENNTVISNKDAEKELHDKLNALKSGESIDLIAALGLNPILFKFDKFSLSADAKKTLDSVICCVKQHPDLIMKISVFTDCRGSASYNKQLSQKRALAIREYIRKKNSTLVKRTKFISLGEKNLLADCGCNPRIKNKCTVQEHMMNRRAEVKVVK